MPGTQNSIRATLVDVNCLRDAETANIPFLDGTGGRIASLCRVCVACHKALDTPSTASPQHHQKRDIDNFLIPNKPQSNDNVYSASTALSVPACACTDQRLESV